MKRIFILGIALLATAACYSQTVVDEVIAVVGKNMIKYSDLETTYLQLRAKGDKGTTRCQVLDDMLLNKLMLNQAEVDSVSITDDEVEKELDSRIHYMISMYGSQEKFEQQMKKSLSEIKDTYRDIIKENKMIQSAQSTLVGDIKMTPQEVADFYNKLPKDSLPEIDEEYEFTQIVKQPTVSKEEKEAVKERLNELRERILKGDKFSTLAAMYSNDEGSARKGGELGFFARGQMVGDFESVAFSLQPGEISPVFETKYGFHIIQMIERRGDMVNVRHILLQPKVSATELYNAKLQLDTIKADIDAGKITFEDAIVKYSDDASKINGGIIINPNNNSAIFSKDAINETMNNVTKVDFNSMKQGEYTEPVEFQDEQSNAYRLIKVKKKKEKHTVNLVDDFDKIQNLAMNEKRTSILRKWAEEKIPNTYISIGENWKNCSYQLPWVK